VPDDDADPAAPADPGPVASLDPAADGAEDAGPSALSSVPASGSRRGMPPTGTLTYFYGPMDCGKSTLALQVDHNHARQGRRGLLLTRLDRSRRGQITSRMGLARPAVEVDDHTDLADLVRNSWAAGRRVDYLIVDEAQFFTEDQVEQLAQLADDAQVDVYAFGIATDFRGKMFPGSQRLFELADQAVPLQVEVLCWCGRPGRFNARVIDGVVVREGAQVVVADTESGAAASTVHYQVLCRRHHRSGDRGPTAGAGTLPLPGDETPGAPSN
jgi:thymidine kinase